MSDPELGNVRPLRPKSHPALDLAPGVIPNIESDVDSPPRTPPRHPNHTLSNYESPPRIVHNSDPALDPHHQHHHAHLHHDSFSRQEREDEVVYTQGTTFERSAIPEQSPQDDELRRRHHPERPVHFAHVAPAAGTERTNTMSTAVNSADNPERKEKTDVNIIDAERGTLTSESTTPEADPQRHSGARFYRNKRLIIHVVIFLLATAWWIVGLVLHRRDRGWLIPFLVYLCISLRLLFFHVPITIVTKPMRWVWNQTGVRIANIVPERLKLPTAAAVVVLIIMIGAFISPESADNTRANRAISLFGLLVFICVLWATSKDRKRIQWHTVIVGMLFQFIIALFVLRTSTGYDIFKFVSDLCRQLLDSATQGTIFLTSADVAKLPYFIISVLPAIIFFVALVQLLYYIGFIQWFIGKFAVFFFWSMRVSGAEAVVAAASPFIGQGESAMLIKPFIAHLTKAELHQVMTSGFATIAGSVLVAYIALGVNPQALVSSCVMSIPASLAISKLRYPENEETLTAGRVVIPDDDDHEAANSLHAFANGAWLGLKIAGMIAATLLCILALLALVNSLLTWFGHYLSINNLTIELLVGYLCYPVAFLLGVPRNGDMLKVAQLIGTKLIANEFVAYNALQNDAQYADLSARSRLIATYALCGFANLGSLGTQIGVLSQLAPGRAGDVSRLAVSALLAGAISTFTSASIAGLLVTNEAAYTTPSVAHT